MTRWLPTRVSRATIRRVAPAPSRQLRTSNRARPDAAASEQAQCLTPDPIADQLAALRDRMDLIWQQHEREHTQHELAHAREHKFAQDAIDKAADLAKENKAAANEWRAAMNDRESKFATKDDVQAILGRLVGIERSDIVAAERERQRTEDDVEHRQELERRTTRSQWVIGIIVGLLATFGAILVNTVIRLAGT